MVGQKIDGQRARIVLVVVAGFVAVTALGGGVALATGMEADRFPLALLDGTPFSSYLIPGLILALAVGGSATIATATLLRRSGASGFSSTLAGAILTGWIVGEVLLLPMERSWVEVLYFALGIVMLLLGAARKRAPRDGGAS
jgi:hypothetical protein